MEILLTEFEIWKEEDEVRRPEPRGGHLTFSVGRASVETGLPPCKSRILVYTRRRYISKGFDMQKYEKSKGTKINVEGRVDDSPAVPS